MRLEEFVAARGHALLQLATLLSRDPADAQPLLDDALADLAVHFGRAERGEGPEAYARRALVRRAGRRGRGPHGPEHGRRPAGAEVEDTARHFLRAIPPRARAVLVLRLWLDLDDAQVADLIDTSPAAVRASADKHLGKLRAALPDRDVEAELRHVLLADAGAAPQPPRQLAAAVTRLARGRRRRRVTATSAAAAAAVGLAAVLVPWLRDVAQGPEPDVSAALALPMRLSDCPGGRLHSATEPRLPPSQPPARTVEQLLAQAWQVTGRPHYPDAVPRLAERSASARTYVFLTPEGHRVGVVRLLFSDGAWGFVHLEYC